MFPYIEVINKLIAGKEIPESTLCYIRDSRDVVNEVYYYLF